MPRPSLLIKATSKHKRCVWYPTTTTKIKMLSLDLSATIGSTSIQRKCPPSYNCHHLLRVRRFYGPRLTRCPGNWCRPGNGQDKAAFWSTITSWRKPPSPQIRTNHALLPRRDVGVLSSPKLLRDYGVISHKISFPKSEVKFSKQGKLIMDQRNRTQYYRTSQLIYISRHTLAILLIVTNTFSTFGFLKWG